MAPLPLWSPALFKNRGYSPRIRNPRDGRVRRDAAGCYWGSRCKTGDLRARHFAHPPICLRPVRQPSPGIESPECPHARSSWNRTVGLRCRAGKHGGFVYGHGWLFRRGRAGTPSIPGARRVLPAGESVIKTIPGYRIRSASGPQQPPRRGAHRPICL